MVAMPSKHPRIAVTANPELGDALERVREITGTREADATLVRRRRRTDHSDGQSDRPCAV
jgi:hypothetical protein